MAAPAIGARAATTDVDVVIVGAGAAGIAAARRLAAAKVRFVVIEGTDHVGGRCVTDTKTFDVPFDRGAHWIHRPQNNEPVKLAEGSNLRIYPAPRGRDAGGARPDDHHIDVAGRGACADSRRRYRGSASCQNCAARNRVHGIRNIDATGDIA